MNNPFFGALGGGNGFMQMLQQFQQFRANFQGNPKAEVEMCIRDSDMGVQSGSGRYYPYASAAFDISRNTATGATGGGKAHNNMPPYLTVYAWRRTA